MCRCVYFTQRIFCQRSIFATRWWPILTMPCEQHSIIPPPRGFRLDIGLSNYRGIWRVWTMTGEGRAPRQYLLRWEMQAHTWEQAAGRNHTPSPTKAEGRRGAAGRTRWAQLPGHRSRREWGQRIVSGRWVKNIFWPKIIKVFRMYKKKRKKKRLKTMSINSGPFRT